MCAGLSLAHSTSFGDGLAAVATVISAANPFVLFLWNASLCSLQSKLLRQLMMCSW